MSQWEIDLEPEVESWLDGLSFLLYQRVMRNVDDYLVTGGIPDGDHVKKLKDAEGCTSCVLPSTARPGG